MNALRLICLFATTLALPLASAGPVEDATDTSAQETFVEVNGLTADPCLSSPESCLVALICADDGLGGEVCSEQALTFARGTRQGCWHYEGQVNRSWQQDHRHRDCLLDETEAGQGVNCSTDEYSYGPDSGRHPGLDGAYQKNTECMVVVGNSNGIYVCIGYSEVVHESQIWDVTFWGCMLGVTP